MLENRIRYFSTYNFSEKDNEDENEDAQQCHFSKDGLRFSLSDGAGGIGVFSRAWARVLADDQPEFALDSNDAWNQWLLKCSESFYNHINPEGGTVDQLILQKFFKEGSNATILYVWISEGLDRISSLGIGDTCLFHFRLSNLGIYRLEKLYPINSYRSIDDFPKLLNWNRNHLDWDSYYENSILKNDVIICCTDGLARFFIRTLFSRTPTVFGDDLTNEFIESLNNDQKQVTGSSIDSFLEMIVDFFELESSEEKIKTLQSWIDEGLEPDDFTITYYIHG